MSSVDGDLAASGQVISLSGSAAWVLHNLGHSAPALSRARTARASEESAISGPFGNRRWLCLLRLAPDGVSQRAVKRRFGFVVLLLGNLALLVLDFQLEELFL